MLLMVPATLGDFMVIQEFIFTPLFNRTKHRHQYKQYSNIENLKGGLTLGHINVVVVIDDPTSITPSQFQFDGFFQLPTAAIVTCDTK